MAHENQNVMRQARHRYVEAAKQLARLRRRAKRGPLTAGQKSRLAMLEGQVKAFGYKAQIAMPSPKL